MFTAIAVISWIIAIFDGWMPPKSIRTLIFIFGSIPTLDPLGAVTRYRQIYDFPRSRIRTLRIRSP
jgi:hypothetical protein